MGSRVPYLDEQLAIFLDVFVRLLLLHLLLRFDGNVDVDAQFLVSVVEVQPQLRAERGTKGEKVRPALRHPARTHAKSMSRASPLSPVPTTTKAYLRVRPERGTAVVGFGLSVHVLEQLALQQNRQNLRRRKRRRGKNSNMLTYPYHVFNSSYSLLLLFWISRLRSRDKSWIFVLLSVLSTEMTPISNI